MRGSVRGTRAEAARAAACGGADKYHSSTTGATLIAVKDDDAFNRYLAHNHMTICGECAPAPPRPDARGTCRAAKAGGF